MSAIDTSAAATECYYCGGKGGIHFVGCAITRGGVSGTINAAQIAAAPIVAGSKDTNPKDSIGVRKAPLSTLPFRVLSRVGLAMLEGACKYGRHNYRAAGVRASVYFDAVVARHLASWWEGEDIDADSGLHHVDKAIAGLMVMRDSMLQGNFVDDRPPATVNDMSTLNKMAGEIIDRHADKTPKHYTIEDVL